MEQLLSTSEAAQLLGVQPGTLRTWRVEGFGPRFIRLGRGRRSPVAYRPGDVEAFLTAQGRRSTADDLALEMRSPAPLSLDASPRPRT